MICAMRKTVPALGLLTLCGIHMSAVAAGGPPGTVYACWDSVTHSRRISQTEFVDCKGEQTARTPGGAVTIIGPALRLVVIDDAATRERRRQAALVSHFPDERAHNAARAASLAPMLANIQKLQARKADIERERPALLEETEFYVGKPLPDALRRKIDENEARMAAVLQLLQNVREDVRLTNARYDSELAELRLLWAPAPRRR